MNVTAVLYDGFETLDVFGPVEMLGCSGECEVRFRSLHGGVVAGKYGVRVSTEPLDGVTAPGALLLPGGHVDDALEDGAFIDRLGELASAADHVLSVCNGAFLFARAGVLDGRLATTYKGLIDKAEAMFPQVRWQRSARWTIDGNVYASSGVSAGTDMALGFLADAFGRECAEKAARYAEYTWNDDPGNDPFAR